VEQIRPDGLGLGLCFVPNRKSYAQSIDDFQAAVFGDN
jgi:hypothetical protein